MTDRPTKRSLLLAGGGLKVAAQAGVLQVLLSEIQGLEFDHVDACSGGAFNLAMLCQGRSGVEVADTWRQTQPAEGVSLLRDLLRLPLGRSLLTFDAYRQRVFPEWGLDWDAIQASTVPATFTAWSVTEQRRHVFTPAQMSEDALVACLSQAVWFPPVTVDGATYTDAVFDTDANVEEALARGADEIWVIWTVSRRSEWLPGPVAQFFHALEEAANGRLAADRRLIERNNEVFDRNEYGLYGRRVELKVIPIEVPVHYLVLLGPDRLHRMVELGVRAARRWLQEEEPGWAARVRPIRSEHRYTNSVTLTFPDRLRGRLGNRPADMDLDLVVPDVGEFVSTGVQRAVLRGHVTSPLLGGRVPVQDGSYANILVDEPGDPTRKRMEYVVHLETRDGQPRTLIGSKSIDSGNLLWLLEEITTMPVCLVGGPVDELSDVHEADVLARGTLRMGFLDVVRQLIGACAEGGDAAEKVSSLARFGGMFVGHLWDVYLRKVISYSPF